MHQGSRERMQELLEKYAIHLENLSLADVGSYDVNGTYKSTVEKIPSISSYTGIDIEKGPNVDIVVPNTNEPVTNINRWLNTVQNQFDVIISGQCIEHVRKPWNWIEQIASITKPGGIVIIVGPWHFDYHPFPIDCWRVLPDGMEGLLDHGGFSMLEVGFDPAPGVDCWGVGKLH